MTVGDFPALTYGLSSCPHGILFGGYCWQCSGSALQYAPFPSLTPPQGWQCPVCSHVMSPSMTVCPYCPSTPPPVTMTTTGSIGVSTTADSGEEAAQPAETEAGPADGTTLKVTLSPEWAEGSVEALRVRLEEAIRPLRRWPPVAPDAAPMIRLPEYMGDGGVHASWLTCVWHEVFSGFEARLERAVDGRAEVHFRLTPDDSQQHG
jgi:hypothetical protein